MNLPDPMTVEEGLETLERLGQAVEVAKSALKTGPWRPSDENPQEVWGYPAHMVIGGHFVILDLERLQKSGLSCQDRIAQLEAACAAMREALQDEQSEIIRGGRHHVEERRMGIIAAALSTDAGKSLLERLQAVEAERDRYKTALVKLWIGDFVGTPINEGCGAMRVIEDALSWSEEEVQKFIKEYDEGKHPLSAEDEAALERSRPELMRRLKALQPAQKDPQ